MAFWISVVLIAVIVGYPLSFGPACWVASRGDYDAGPTIDLLVSVYYPIVRLWCDGPDPIAEGIYWYANLAADRMLIVFRDPFNGRYSILRM